MTRRQVAIALAPMPAVAWWGWSQPVDFLAWSLVALLAISATAGCGLWGMRAAACRTPCTIADADLVAVSNTFDTDVAAPAPRAPGTEPAEPSQGPPASPAEVLATVAGVDVTELLARVERLEEQSAWVAGGVDDVETYANLPPPAPDVLAFLEQLDGEDHAAG